MLTDSEMLDKAIETFVELKLEIPCFEMCEYDYCEQNCKYDHPQKECWKVYLSGKYKESRADENG